MGDKTMHVVQHLTLDAWYKSILAEAPFLDVLETNLEVTGLPQLLSIAGYVGRILGLHS